MATKGGLPVGLAPFLFLSGKVDKIILYERMNGMQFFLS